VSAKIGVAEVANQLLLNMSSEMEYDRNIQVRPSMNISEVRATPLYKDL
jgi:hypothetical protein